MQATSRWSALRRSHAFVWVVIGLVLGIALTGAWQVQAQGNDYDPQLDVNHDGVIDTLDIQSTAGSWNTTGDPTLVNLVARGYYQTSSTFMGNQALTACTTGSTWRRWPRFSTPACYGYAREIPGAVQGADSGFGPPYSITGWIRTGVDPGVNNQVGAGNCQVWTSNSAAHFGTTVALNPDWLGTVTNISPWDGVTFACNAARRVWRVQD